MDGTNDEEENCGILVLSRDNRNDKISVTRVDFVSFSLIRYSPVLVLL